MGEEEIYRDERGNIRALALLLRSGTSRALVFFVTGLIIFDLDVSVVQGAVHAWAIAELGLPLWKWGCETIVLWDRRADDDLRHGSGRALASCFSSLER